jgi:hypothetical protein
LIEAMANAWRFVENPEHRERLKEAKGIGTPATRAEVIQGLKRQEFLVVSGKHIVPTDRGLALFDVLGKADPALVDPAVTAKLEFLLDEVLYGRRRAEEAIDAVCGQASRIIGRLRDGTPEARHDGAGWGQRHRAKSSASGVASSGRNWPIRNPPPAGRDPRRRRCDRVSTSGKPPPRAEKR